jgi:hypothetical protein
MADLDGTVDALIARLAFRTYGVVTRRKLLAAHVTRHEISGRIRRGTLLIEYPGVYRVGHRAPSLEASYLAAVWACGDEAFTVGLAALHLLGLVRGEAPAPEVMAPVKRRVEGITTRRYRSLRRNEVMRWRGIPVTTVARTLVDVAASLPVEDLARACHEAGVRYRTAPRHIEAILRHRPNAPGAGKLRAVMSGDAPALLSELERGFIAVLREEQLPLPETNRPAGSFYVDCRWPEHRLTVELDSFRYHNSRRSWEQDRRREREARARGDEFRRYTWADVFEQSRLMRADLRGLLA